MDPGRGPAGPARFAEPRVAPRGLPPVRLDGRGGHGRRARVAARPSCGSRARPRRSWPRPTATQAVGALDPWLGAALAVAEATRNVSITGARPLGVTNCLNYGDPTRPEAFWQLSRGRPRPRPTRAWRSGCPVTGGNVSLYNESPDGRDRADAGDRRRRAARRRRDARRAGVRAARDDAILVVGEAVPGLAGSAYAGLAGRAAEDDPPALDLAREAALQAFVREAIAPGPRRVGPGRLGRRARRRPRRMRDVGRARGAASGVAGRALAGGRPVRREPVAARPDRAGPATRRRSRCSPASTACRSRRSGRSVATAW